MRPRSSAADLAADGRLTFVAGDRDAALAALDDGGATIVPESLAARLGLTVDQILRVPTADGGLLDLRVAGIVERSIPGRGGEAMLVGWGDATDQPRRRRGRCLRRPLRTRTRRPPPATTLRSSAAQLALEVVTLDRIEGAISDALGRIFGLFDALAAVAVLIAALGIVNTLTMNVIERVREIGILRAAGMTRGQVWRSVVVEAGVLGLAGALLGIVLGLVVGGADGRPGRRPARRRERDARGRSSALALVLGVVVAMLAAAYPARLASRLSIVRAVQYE